MLQATSLLIDVTANDWPGSSLSLAVTDVTQPLSGTTAVEQNQVRFTPWLDFHGDDFFYYAISDGNGLGSSARVAVVVADPATTVGTPLHLPLPDLSVTTLLTVTTSAGDTVIVLPAGSILTGSLPNYTVFDLVYTELTNPSPPLMDADYAGRAFVLHFFIDAELQNGYVFAQPIRLTLSYDPALVPNPSKLALFFYDEKTGKWSDDGITIVAVDNEAHTFTASVAHLTQFAAAIRAPTAEEVVDEPAGPFRLYLPVINN